MNSFVAAQKEYGKLLLSKEEGLTYIFRGAVTRILDILEKTNTFPTHM